VETNKDLFKELDKAEKLFQDGSIKNAQKLVRYVLNESKKLNKVPNKLRHKLNFSLAQSRYFDDVSAFAANPKRNELINEIKKIAKTPHDKPKQQANHIHEIQTKWQHLDHTSKPASKDQWKEFNEFTNVAWEPCKDFFNELKQIKIENAINRKEIINSIDTYNSNNSKKWPNNIEIINFLRSTYEEWLKFAPVLDEDFKNLKQEFFRARKPLNDQIKKQDKLIKQSKLTLIEKVKELNSEDNDSNIAAFNNLKTEWSKVGRLPKKIESKLWNDFNKNADRFFKEKNKEIEDAKNHLIEVLDNIDKSQLALNDIEAVLNENRNLSKSQEYKSLQKAYKNKIEEKKQISKTNKLKDYKNIFELISKPDTKLDLNNYSKQIKDAIEKSYVNLNSDKKNFQNECVVIR
jgi:exonuclease SbcC